MTLIRQFHDGSTLRFGRGTFDDWCVLLTNGRVQNYAPRDIEYFTRLNALAAFYGEKRIYADFVRIYVATGTQLQAHVLDTIAAIATDYSTHRHAVELLFTMLYATMVAEENKHKAILKKRIKRLAVHQLLIEAMPVAVVTSFSKGKRWNELDAECRRRGF